MIHRFYWYTWFATCGTQFAHFIFLAVFFLQKFYVIYGMDKKVFHNTRMRFYNILIAVINSFRLRVFINCVKKNSFYVFLYTKKMWNYFFICPYEIIKKCRWNKIPIPVRHCDITVTLWPSTWSYLTWMWSHWSRYRRM